MQNQNHFQGNTNVIDKNMNMQMSLIYIKIQNVIKNLKYTIKKH